MKKIMITLAICAVVMTGCGSSGVSQEEYDKVVAERDELKSKYESAENEKELQIKITEYQAKVDAEYEHAKFILYIAENAANVDTSEASKNITQTHDDVLETIQTVNSMFDSAGTVIDISPETYETAIESMDKIYNAWEEVYLKVYEVENLIMGN